MKRILAALISIIIMGVILSRVSLAELGDLLLHQDPWLGMTAFFLFIPQTLVSAFRWKVMVQKKASLGMGESTRLVLAASALNLFLPSKMGDLCKAYFLKKEGKLPLGRGTNIVILERYIDLCALSLVVLTGVVFGGAVDETTLAGILISVGILSLLPVFFAVRLDGLLELPFFGSHPFLFKLKRFLYDAQLYLAEIRQDWRQLSNFFSLSIVLWFLHLFQFYLVFLALGSDVSCFLVFRLVPLAILFGLLPITIAGVGTRDGALLVLFAGYAEPALIVSIGLFATLRYLVPGLAGLVFLNRYLIRDTQSLHESSPSSADQD